MTMTWASKVHFLHHHARVPSGGPARDTGTPDFRVAAYSERGETREVNGDQYLVAELDRTVRVLETSMPTSTGRVLESPRGLLMAVADGFEEVKGGDVASALAIETLVDHVAALVPWIGAAWLHTPEVEKGFRTALEECQERLREVAARDGLDVRLGTTLTAAYVSWPLAHIVHVGDSRCYLYRKGSLVRLTRDQTLAQRLVDAGEMRERELRHSRLRSTLTSVLGGTGELEVEVAPVVLQPDDLLLLCTDGFYEELDDHQIRKALDRTCAPREDVSRCVRYLVAKAKHAGGDDDVTVAVAAFS